MVLKYSSIYDRARWNVILNEDPLTLSWQVCVRPYLLEDLGHPLLSWLIIPIFHLDAHGVIAREEHHFNHSHRKGRRHIE